MKNKTPKPRVMWANYYPGIVRCDETLKRAKHRADYNLPNQTVRVAIIPLDDTEAIVERAANAFITTPYVNGDNPDACMRAALTAAGIPCTKRKARK
jgi:hypothetical protein